MLMQSKYFKKMHFIKFCDVVAEIRMLTEIKSEEIETRHSTKLANNKRSTFFVISS